MQAKNKQMNKLKEYNVYMSSDSLVPVSFRFVSVSEIRTSGFLESRSPRYHEGYHVTLSKSGDLKSRLHAQTSFWIQEVLTLKINKERHFTVRNIVDTASF